MSTSPHQQIFEKEPAGSDAPTTATAGNAEDSKPMTEEKTNKPDPESQQGTDEHQTEDQENDTDPEVTDNPRGSSPDSPERKASGSSFSEALSTEVKEESAETPVEKTEVGPRSDGAEEKTEVEPTGHHVEEKMANGNQTEVKEVDQYGDKVVYRADTTESEQTEALHSTPSRGADDFKPEERHSPRSSAEIQQTDGQRTSETTDSSAPADSDVAVGGTASNERPVTSQLEPEDSPPGVEDVQEKEEEKEAEHA